jgi:DNA-binding response OmpR family regulator
MNIIKEYISYKHLCIDDCDKMVVLLGYKLNVTKTEYQVLFHLVSHNNKPISASLLSAYTGENFSKEKLTRTVFNINRKAYPISKRKLIKNIAKIGYFLNEEM